MKKNTSSYCVTFLLSPYYSLIMKLKKLFFSSSVRTILLFTGFMLCCIPTLKAQTSTEASSGIRIIGTVIPTMGGENIIFDTIYEVHFEQEFVGDNAIVVDPITDIANPESGSGYVVAKGQPNAEFQLNFSRQIVMRHSNGTSVLVVNYLLSSNNIDEQENSVYVQEVSPRFRLNSDGEYHFWIGGQVNITDAEEGEYFGEFILEVEYI
jgi:hypothetical protein